MSLLITPLPPGTLAVRHFPPGSNVFDWSVNVSLSGDTLTLYNFNPGPSHAVPTLGEWRALAKEYFPTARRVRFERRNRGSRWVEARIW